MDEISAEEISEENLSSMCRLCLNDKAKCLIDVSDDTIYKNLFWKIQSLTEINIFENPKLPQKICNICLQKINDFHGFKKVCKFSEELLQKKFPHLLEEPNITQDFLQVLIKESPRFQDASELITIKDEFFADFEDIKDGPEINNDQEAASDEASELSSTTEIPTVRKKKEPVKKKTIEKKIKSKYDSRRYPCHLCGKTYKKFNLEVHLNAHNNIRPYKCQVEGCDKSFAAPTGLRAHRHCHSKFNLECEICKKVYQSTKALFDHKRFRHKEPDVPCTQCDMKFKTNKCLKKHMLRHTGERKHLCKYCPKTFATGYNLKVHTRIHTGDKPFTCELCGVSFAYNSLMKAHNEKYHPEALINN